MKKTPTLSKSDVPLCVVEGCKLEATSPGAAACGEHVTTVELKQLLKHRDRNVMNRVVTRVSFAEDSLTAVESSIGRSLEFLVENLAALVETASPNRSPNWDNEGRRSAETSLPNTDSARAERRLVQAERNLRLEAESIASFLHAPWREPHNQRSKERHWCQNKDCDRYRVRLPKWARSGESWVDLAPVCVGQTTKGVCAGRLEPA